MAASSSIPMAELAAAWLDGLTKDFAAVDSMSAPDMRVWHSTDAEWIDRGESDRRARLLEGAGRPVFSDVRTRAIDGGFLLQAAVEPQVAGGRVAFLVQIVTVVDGVVTAVEEYLAPGPKPSRR